MEYPGFRCVLCDFAFFRNDFLLVHAGRAKYNGGYSVIYRLILGNYRSFLKVPLNQIGDFSKKSPTPIGNFLTYSELLTDSGDAWGQLRNTLITTIW